MAVFTVSKMPMIRNNNASSPISIFSYIHCILIPFLVYLNMVESSALSFFELTESLKHDHTFKKAAILNTLHYLHDYHIRIRKEDVFYYFNISPRTGFYWIAENESRRLHNHPDSGPDSRGQKRKLTCKDLQKMKDLLVSGFHYRILNWQQLATMTGIFEVCDCII